jgi:hypothetical protein
MMLINRPFNKKHSKISIKSTVNNCAKRTYVSAGVGL